MEDVDGIGCKNMVFFHQHFVATVSFQRMNLSVKEKDAERRGGHQKLTSWYVGRGENKQVRLA